MMGHERLGRVLFSGHNLALFISVALFLALGPVNTFALHNSTANLEPRWSPEGAMVNYTVVIGNQGPDTVTEVRIYKNENYENFKCDEKTGWELLFIGSLQACFYVQNPKTIPAGQSETFTFSAKTKIQPAEICDLQWRFETRDNNNVWQFVFNVTGIDHDPPVINKSVLGASFGPCPPGSGETCWIRQDTGVNIYAIHPSTDQCNSGLAYCNWSYTVDGLAGAKGTFLPNGNGIINETLYFKEDSLHILNVTCVDNALNAVNDVEAFRVDSTKPVTEKDEGTPMKEVETEFGLVRWITTKTPITLESFDPDPTGHSCNVSANATYFRNLLLTANGENACRDEDLCNPEYYYEFLNQTSNLSWNKYVAPFFKKEDSCHIIEYYSIDKLGNREDTKWQCIFVDNKPPVSVKVHGTPLVHDEGFDWVTQNTKITLDCKDKDPHPVAQETLCYKVSLDDKSPAVNLTGNYCNKFGGKINNENYCCIYVGDDGIKRNLTLNFLEDSNHSLSYYCRDHLGNDERDLNQGKANMQRYKVDTKPPIISKTMFGSYLGKCPPKNATDVCYVADNGKSGVNIIVKDGGNICSVDQVKCHYDIFWDELPGRPVESGDFCGGNKTIIFGEDSRHTLIINCTDALGNSVKDTEVFLVDSTPPVTNKTYSGPIYTQGTSKWITSNTTITLNAADAKSGVNKTYWRNLLMTKNGETACSNIENCNPKYYNQFIANDTGWKDYLGPFRKPEDSCHVVEYYSTDKLGNKENTKLQCVFVDNKPPLMNKTVGLPRFECPDDELCSYFITGNTSITLSCTDQEPHPSDNVSILYRYRIGNDCLTWGNWSGWIDPAGTQVKKTIYFKEDSCHNIEYYCKDALGNMDKIYFETDVVDSKPPVINKTIFGPMSGKCPPVNSSDVCFIDNVTEIRVNALDPAPHPSDNVTCDWSYTVRGKDIFGGKKWVAPPFSIKFPEESTHDLTILCRDALNNTAKDTKTFYVDHTPPATTKKYKGPFFMNGKTGPEWISQNTSINLTVVDAGQHKSGINATKYRTTLVDDRYCMNQTICQSAQGSGEWKIYSKEFNISQDSCHLIEYFSTDNVNKSETVKKQCAFVDTMAPDPAKTVADPKTKWDGLDSTFYPEIKDLCWNGKLNGIECWKVTLFTPITLHCKDPLPHPVGHESLCFKVDFDGTDKTQDYCEEGDMNKGWCCGYPAGTELYFSEESEHNLKYYCVDALGNTGPTDEEKFKVEGTTFNITINKKWNLISVPFVMLNDSISDVFKNVTDKVESVWTFDGKTSEWFVYTPGPAPDTLTEMMPGWGYWVKATNDTVLVIGGSLFRPAQAPPSKEIVEGWNLIGYWGTEGLTGYYGPFGNGKNAACELYSLGPTIWSKEFASLWSYWEPYNPNQWLQYSSSSRMDPGAGYWMYTKQQGEFVPPTTCVDNVV